MKKTYLCLALSALLLALCAHVDAQQPGKIPRIGYVSRTGDAGNPGPQVDAFRQGLRDLGYIEGKNILIDFRYIEGRPGSAENLAAELVQLKIDVLVVTSRPTIEAAKQATKTIPVVMVLPDDPVERGFVKSLAHPGGNMTGITTLSRELSGKRLEILRDTVPGLARVGVIWSTSNNRTNYRDYEPAARALKLTLRSLAIPVQNPDWSTINREIANGRVGAMIAIATVPLLPHRGKILDLTIKHRMPAMFEVSDWADAGGLMSYAAYDADNYRRVATYVDKILKGVKPADLPVEQPTKFEFVINLKTAKQIGVAIPPEVLARANRIIR